VIALDGTDRSVELVKEQEELIYKVECHARNQIKATMDAMSSPHCQWKPAKKH
jgi:hypothetical protein